MPASSLQGLLLWRPPLLPEAVEAAAGGGGGLHCATKRLRRWKPSRLRLLTRRLLMTSMSRGPAAHKPESCEGTLEPATLMVRTLHAATGPPYSMFPRGVGTSCQAQACGGHSCWTCTCPCDYKLGSCMPCCMPRLGRRGNSPALDIAAQFQGHSSSGQVTTAGISCTTAKRSAEDLTHLHPDLLAAAPRCRSRSPAPRTGSRSRGAAPPAHAPHHRPPSQPRALHRHSLIMHKVSDCPEDSQMLGRAQINIQMHNEHCARGFDGNE